MSSVLPAFALPIMDFGDGRVILLFIHGTKAVRRKGAKGGGEFGGWPETEPNIPLWG
jgi:hypothetical protein